MIKGLKKICTHNKEPLYLANSSDLINLIRELNLIEMYPNLANVADASYSSDCPFSLRDASPLKKHDRALERIVEVKRLMQAYNNNFEEEDEVVMESKPTRALPCSEPLDHGEGHHPAAIRV